MKYELDLLVLTPGNLRKSSQGCLWRQHDASVSLGKPPQRRVLACEAAGAAHDLPVTLPQDGWSPL